MTTSGKPDTSQWANAFAATTAPSGAAPSSICSSVPSAWSAANRRPSESRLESSAATQIAPGAMARSNAGSAPMPSGNSVVTMTKKSSAVPTSLRLRSASKRSRRKRQARTSAIEVDDLSLDARILVGGEDHHAALRHVRADQRLDRTCRMNIEGGERLVEQPQRRRAAEREAGERRSPALALRKLFQQRTGRHLQAL